MHKLANLTSKYRASIIINAYSYWVNRGENCLDVGCGTGIVAKEIKNKFRVNLTGCDIEEYLHTDIPFKKMEKISKLPFHSNSFDKAMFNDVLHHTTYDNQEKLLKDAVRVSREVLIFELKPNITSKIFDYILNKIHHPGMNIPFTYRTKSEWQKLFLELGLKCTYKKVKSPSWYPFTHIAFKLMKTK